MTSSISKRRPGRLVLFGLFCAAALLAAGAASAWAQPPQQKKQEPDDVERARLLQREMNLNFDELTKALQWNREEIRRALACVNGRCLPAVPGPLGAAAVGRADLGNDYRLGVRVAPLSAVLAAQLKLEQGQGLVVVEVTTNGPADRAGVMLHDILLELNGKKVPSDLPAWGVFLRGVPSDKEVAGVLLRGGARENFKVILPNIVQAPVLPPAAFAPNVNYPPRGLTIEPRFIVVPAVEPAEKDKK